MVNYGKHPIAINRDYAVNVILTHFVHMFKENLAIQIYLIHILQFVAASSTQFY